MIHTDQQNVPKLRFPEFEGEWEAISLYQLSNSGFNNGVFNDPQNVGFGYRLINVKDMFTSAGINTEGLSFLNIAEKEFKKNKVEYGDIFFTRSSLVKEGIAFSNVFLSQDEDVTYDGHLIKMSPNTSKLFPLFGFYSLRTTYARRQLVALGKTTTMTTIGQDDISKTNLSTPTLPEQRKIASFLGTMDTKIAQLAEKKRLLEDYKKGCMQQLFSQKIRFKDDSGQDFPDWEEKRLGEVLTIGSGRDYKHLGTGNIPVHGTGGLMTFVDDFLHDGESVCIGRKGTIDKPVFLTGKFWTVDTLFYTHSFQNAVPRFIYAIFQQINWQMHNEASGVPSLSKSTIERLKVSLPHPDEQLKIAEFLSALDRKIDLVGQELAHARTFKQGLLQQMFV